MTLGARIAWARRAGLLRPSGLVRVARYFRLRCRRGVILQGYVSVGRGVRLEIARGHGRIVIGRYVHLGDGTQLRAHGGTLRIGEKSVLGQRVVVLCYLDVEIGDACLIADDVFIADFDHRFDSLDVPIKDQGICATPVRIGSDVWLGTRVIVTRGVEVGDGVVVGAAAVVSRDLPPRTIAVGVPARIVASRDKQLPGNSGIHGAGGVPLRPTRRSTRQHRSLGLPGGRLDSV